MNSDIPRSHLADAALRQRAESAGLDLQQALDAVLAELARNGFRDQKSLQGVLKLSQSAISRLMSAVRSNDPLAALFATPGQEALRQMLKGAAQHGVARDTLVQAEAAITALEAFTAGEMGDRATLEAVLSDWAVEARGHFELRHKTAAFRALSALRGVQAEVVLSSGILYPSPDTPGFHECLGLDAVLGCRRTRPSGVLRICGASMPPAGEPYSVTGLDGQAIHTMPDMVLPSFTTIAADQIQVTRHHHEIETTVTGLPMGTARGGAADLVFAQRFRGLHRSHRGTGRPTAGLGGQAEPPTEVFIVDALLHEDVWTGVTPELKLYDTVVRGIAHPDDPARAGDQLDMLEAVQFLGRGLAAFRLPEFPRYLELIQYGCEALGWDPGKLRGYRCRVRYPLYGEQIGLAFKLPETTR
jgi:hypothetical protein